VVAESINSEMGARLGTLGRSWGWFLAFGIISIAAGLIAIFWPGSALLAIAIIFGAYLVASGIFRFVGAFAVPAESGWVRALMALLAVLSFIVGLYLLRHPVYTILIVALVLGLFWMVSGVIQLFAAIGRTDMPSRGWRIASGILSIIAGAIVFFWPSISLLVLAIVLGVWLVIYGVTEVAASLALRSETRRHPTSLGQAAT